LSNYLDNHPEEKNKIQEMFFH